MNMRYRLLAVLLLAAAAVAGTFASFGDSRTSYVHRRGDRTTMMTISGGIPDLNALTRRYGSEYVWARQEGREYIITDAAVLAEVRAAFAKLDEVEAPMRGLEERMKPHEREMEKIESRLDALADQLDDEDLSDSARDAIEEKMQAVEKERQAVEDRMEVVEREMETLSDRIERHAEAAEAQLEQLVNRAVRSGKALRLD